MRHICNICGKPITCCMTNDNGSFYVCEGECFETYMDETYGKHKWMALGNGEQDEYGGYYIAAENVAGGYIGTGIYYTEFDDDEEDE